MCFGSLLIFEHASAEAGARAEAARATKRRKVSFGASTVRYVHRCEKDEHEQHHHQGQQQEQDDQNPHSSNHHEASSCDSASPHDITSTTAVANFTPGHDVSSTIQAQARHIHPPVCEATDGHGSMSDDSDCDKMMHSRAHQDCGCSEYATDDETEQVKDSDGPNDEALHVNEMIVQLYKKRDASVMTDTLRVLAMANKMHMLDGMQRRTQVLMARIRARGKVALLPACIILRQESLPVLEWIINCMAKAVQCVHALEKDRQLVLALSSPDRPLAVMSPHTHMSMCAAAGAMCTSGEVPHVHAAGMLKA